VAVYRKTIDSDGELEQIVDIYNEITGRSRTISQQRWEWFESPYENHSYVVIKKSGEIIGHHGLLSIVLHYQGQNIKVGKTENTIAKKGFGAAYVRNEMEMFREYSKEYDILITTAARGVTKKIRQKLNYVRFARMVTFISVVDFSFLASRVKNKSLKRLIKLVAKPVNLLLGRTKHNRGISYEYKPLKELDLQMIVDFYDSIKGSIKFSQVRTVEFLKYRCLSNPYSHFQLLKMRKSGEIIGIAIYQIMDEKIVIEDVMGIESKNISMVLSGLVSHAKKEKLAEVIVFSTLENSLLDRPYQSFYRKKSKLEAPEVMINKLSNNVGLDGLTVDKMYFTRLLNEGIN
jgi:hypothetical protein